MMRSPQKNFIKPPALFRGSYVDDLMLAWLSRIVDIFIERRGIRRQKKVTETKATNSFCDSNKEFMNECDRRALLW